MSLQVGDRIDRYTVEAVLGSGAMATVYSVRHMALDKRHAVKLLHLSGQDVQERLVREGRVQASLEHSNVLAVNDVLIHNNAPALLMELVQGPALEALLPRHRMSLDEALAIFGGVLGAVNAAHKKQVTHRDLKPGNILLHVTEQGIIPKVGDFGLAKALDPKGTNKTATGIALGTPAYMAPEQIRDAKRADHRADIFSLGCILYELVTGHRAFAAPDILETYKKVTQGLYTAPREYVPDLPYHIATTIERALEIDPNRRFADCEAFGRALFKNEELPTIVAKTFPVYAVALAMKQEADAAQGTNNGGPPSLMTKGSDQALRELTGGVARPPQAPAKSNTMLYAVGGVGLVALLGLVFLLVLGVALYVMQPA